MIKDFAKLGCLIFVVALIVPVVLTITLSLVLPLFGISIVFWKLFLGVLIVTFIIRLLS